MWCTIRKVCHCIAASGLLIHPHHNYTHTRTIHTGLQAVARTISDGPWRPVKTQLAWVLYLLAAKSAGNRELLLRLERTVVTPLAQQLANVEAFYASAAAAAAAVVATVSPSLQIKWTALLCGWLFLCLHSCSTCASLPHSLTDWSVTSTVAAALSMPGWCRVSAG
jgi:hypothetical protein